MRLSCASSSSTRTSTTPGKTFSFPIYRNGNRTIPARAATDGMQDGIDITALATHPDTGRRLARKMWDFFVSEAVEPDEERCTMPRAPICKAGRESNQSSITCCAHVSSRTRGTGVRVLVGRSSIGAGRQRSRLDGFSVDTSARRCRRWVRRCSNRPTSTAGSWARDGLRPAACWRE